MYQEASEPLIQERPAWNVDAKLAELKAKGYIKDMHAQGEQESLDEYANMPEVQSKLLLPRTYANPACVYTGTGIISLATHPYINYIC